MKKNLFFIVAIASAIVFSLSSCKKEAKSTEEPTATEQTEVKAEPAASSVDDAITAYEKLVDELIVVMKDVKAGKTDSAQKLQDLSKKYQETVSTFANTTSYTPAQTERLTKIAQKYADSMK